MLNRQPARVGLKGIFSVRVSRTGALLALLLLLGAILIAQSNLRFFLHDDEGNYAYAAWRISAGEVPYRDFFTPQMPAFLYWGGLVVRLLGRSLAALRWATVLATGLAAWLLYRLNCELFGPPVALASVGLYLIEPNVFHSARFFLPEAYMLVWELAGLYAFALGEKRRRAGYLALAGVFFGLSTLSKLFGALPLVGCLAYLVYAWWRERRPLAEALRQALALGLPALLVVAGVGLAFTASTPNFFAAVFEHHTMQGAGMPLAERAAKAIHLYRWYASGQWLAIALAAVGAGWLLRRDKALPALLVWQVPTALAFALLSRELLRRHFSYLSPALATLMAVALVQVLEAPRHLPRLRRGWRTVAPAVAAGAALALALATARPWMAQDAEDAAQAEHDSARLAALIQSVAKADEQVMADYPGLNFLAGRRSSYWAAGMSAGAAAAGQIRAARLIDELERGDAAAVVINVSRSHAHITQMRDYPRFRRYVQQHYTLVDRFDCTYEQKSFEIYARTDTFPLQPQLSYENEIALQAVRLSETTLASGSELRVDTRWQALQQMRHKYIVSAYLIDAAGRQWAETHARLQNPQQVPTSDWLRQEVSLARFRLGLNPAMPAGDYYLAIAPYYSEEGLAAPSNAVGRPSVGGLPIIATVHVLPPAEAPKATVVPSPSPLAAALFDNHFEILGYELSTTELAPGERLRVTLHWAYLRTVTHDYKLFIHLLDAAGKIQGQCDVVPQGGGAQTSGWVQDDVLMDSFKVPLRRSAAPGPLQIELGFYDSETGQRLPIVRGGLRTAEDALLLPTTVTVR